MNFHFIIFVNIIHIIVIVFLSKVGIIPQKRNIILGVTNFIIIYILVTTTPATRCCMLDYDTDSHMKQSDA